MQFIRSRDQNRLNTALCAGAVHIQTALPQHQLDKAKKAIGFLSSLPTRSLGRAVGQVVHPVQFLLSLQVSEVP